MAKTTTTKDLEGMGFVASTPAPSPRLIASIDGLEKTGKTHLALTAPAPIAYFDLDEGMSEIIDKFPKLSKPGQFLYYHIDYDDEDDDLAEKHIGKVLKAYRSCLSAPDSVVKTIVFDTDSDFWEMLRLARFGRLTQVKPHHYAPVNAEFRRYIRDAKRSNKNLILLHKKKDEYIQTKSMKTAMPTGKKIRAGMKEVGYLVQVVLDLEKDEDGRHCTIVESRHNPDIEGMVLNGEEINFPTIASLVMENDPEEWE